MVIGLQLVDKNIIDTWEFYSIPRGQPFNDVVSFDYRYKNSRDFL